MNLSTLLKAMRLPFVIQSPVCVLLGAGIAAYEQVQIDGLYLTLAILGAILGHLSVNCLNEYSDFRSGLDLNTLKTPFSGGSGALPDNPAMAKTVLWFGISCLLLIFAIGAYFISVRGPAILPVGLLAVALILSYTDWINRHALLCLIAPGTGFGLLMVSGSHFVLTGYYSPLSWFTALLPFFLVNNLLLLNQYPDIEADARAGRRHLPIRFGIGVANQVYGSFAIAGAVVILANYFLHGFPAFSLLALLLFPLALIALKGAIKYGKELGAHPGYLAANVAVSLLVPLVYAIVLFVAPPAA